MTKCQLNRILVTSATDMEMSKVVKIAGLEEFSGTIDTLVTGMGSVNTMLKLGDHLEHNRYNLVIQIGICGAINRSLEVGEVVVVESDYVADLGAWRLEDTKFVPFESEIFKPTNNFQSATLNALKKVSGLTVNTACAPYLDRQKGDVESMEGAAFFAVTKLKSPHVLQLRAVSNYLDTPREEWKIGLALQNLSLVVKNIIFEL